MRVYDELKGFEDYKSEVFNETADAKAKDRLLTWYLCELSYFESDGEWKQILKGKNFEEKLDFYDELLENDDSESEWYKAALDKAMLILSFWYSGKIKSQDDIKLLEDMLKAEPEKEIEKLKTKDE